jgi:hypothetical protein
MSEKTIPFFSSRQSNRIEGYERFRQTRAYIRERSDGWKDLGSNVEQMREFMLACGYNDLEKFRKHRAEWDNLRREVPMAYLDAIGVDIETLKVRVELDREEYHSVLGISLYPRYGTIRYMGGVYGDYPFPEDTPEVDAILMLQEYSKVKKSQCCINYPYVKTIWIKLDGSVHTTYYDPTIRITKKFLMASRPGSRVGDTSLRWR